MTLRDLYEDLHAHPELAFAEVRTAKIAAERLADAGFAVRTGIGGTGVAGVLHREASDVRLRQTASDVRLRQTASDVRLRQTAPSVLLRADMDALPLREETGLPYASEAVSVDARGERTPVMHACGHDMHVTWLAGAAAELAADPDWTGKLVVVFQPAEEIGAGAQAMLADGLFETVGVPDVVLGQHVFPGRAGAVMYREGVMLGAAQSMDVTLFGRGGHGSQPERTVDPVVMAAAAVMRLQTLVARETAPAERAVVTVARMRAGHAENIIPDTSSLTLNFRAFDPAVLSRLVEGARRIIDAEAAASLAPAVPEYNTLSAFPVTENDPGLVEELVGVFGDSVRIPAMMGSEDFGLFGTAAGARSVFWGMGGNHEGAPGNHSPHFAPDPDQVLDAGVTAMVAAAKHVLA